MSDPLEKESFQNDSLRTNKYTKELVQTNFPQQSNDSFNPPIQSFVKDSFNMQNFKYFKQQNLQSRKKNSRFNVKIKKIFAKTSAVLTTSKQKIKINYDFKIFRKKIQSTLFFSPLILNFFNKKTISTPFRKMKRNFYSIKFS